MFSTLKQKFFIRNQKELMLKIQIIALLDKKLKKLTDIFYSIISFFLEKICEGMLHVVVAFQRNQFYWLW